MNNNNDIIQELIDTFISSMFDPNPVQFKPEHERGVNIIRRLLLKPNAQIQKLPKKLIRNAFLCGCLDFTEHEQIEHLIIGYGNKRGAGTDITSIQHFIGTETSVNITPETITYIQGHCLITPNSEIVVFHNHPLNWLNNLMDNPPFPSTVDRNTMLQFKYLEPLQLFRFILGRGGIKFYLGENGFVKEFKMPSVIKLLQFLSSLQQIGGTQ